MRDVGVRRHNVEINTGKRLYAFGRTHYSYLPRELRPPVGSFRGSVPT